jgi:electron transfer flavoprotein alpha subunit
MIVVLVEHEDGAPSDLSSQALTLARELAEPLHALAFGVGAAEALAATGTHGVTSATHVALDAYAPAAWAQALADVVAGRSASSVVAAGTDRGNEVLAHLGARTGAPFVANCVSAEREPEAVTVTRQRWGGTLLEDVRTAAPLVLLSVAPHAVVAQPAGSATTVQIDEVESSPAFEDLRVSATIVPSDASATVSLPEARLVVGGGRGVGSAEGFATLDALAAALGGVVGVSRAVTSAGWRPHAEQIGQTGERIAPDLYIACGISGASQHMVGCRGAKSLLAINSDPDAPILAKADYGVIGDLHAVVPAIVAELERRHT